jgi:hypothetical protein
MTPTRFDRHAHIRKLVYLKHGGLDDLAHQVVHPLIFPRRDAQQLAQAVHAHRFHATSIFL